MENTAPERERWQQRWFAVALAAAMAVPLLWPTVPPLYDVPGHMGRYHVALDLARSADLRRYYAFDWALIGNLGVDLLIMPLGRLLGVEAGTKLIVIATAVATAIGMLWSAREAHGRLPATAPLALVLVYSYAFHYGFLNYCLSMAVVSLAFAFRIRTRDWPALRRAAAFAPIAAVVWIAHAVGWVELCLLCGVFELQHRLRSEPDVPAALRKTAIAAVPFLLPVALMLLAPPGNAFTVDDWLDPKILARWSLSLTRDRWMVYDLLCSAVLIATVALAAFRRFGFSLLPALAWPALALAALSILAPDSVKGSANLVGRIMPWALAYALLAIRTDEASARTEKRWAGFSLAFLTLRLGATTASLALYGQMHDRNLRALDAVPRGSAIAVFANYGCTAIFSNWGNARMQHLGGMALVRRDAFVNDQWQDGDLQLLRTHYPAARPFDAAPSEAVTIPQCPSGYPQLGTALQKLPRRAFNYVWLLDMPIETLTLPPWLRPVHTTANGALYAIVPGEADGDGRG